MVVSCSVSSICIFIWLSTSICKLFVDSFVDLSFLFFFSCLKSFSLLLHIILFSRLIERLIGLMHTNFLIYSHLRHVEGK
uniref:Uncharacterized protein n=1 Tax=Rhizophora mucronata TaxID=61149 RepID=A0A2P2N017_RHIMU